MMITFPSHFQISSPFDRGTIRAIVIATVVGMLAIMTIRSFMCLLPGRLQLRSLLFFAQDREKDIDNWDPGSKFYLFPSNFLGSNHECGHWCRPNYHSGTCQSMERFKKIIEDVDASKASNEFWEKLQKRSKKKEGEKEKQKNQRKLGKYEEI